MRFVCDPDHSELNPAPAERAPWRGTVGADAETTCGHASGRARSGRLAHERGGVGARGAGPRRCRWRARAESPASSSRRTPTSCSRSVPDTCREAGSSSRTRSKPSGSRSSSRACLDVGASTGGFTDCLLQHGAARVVALDVAYGQLDWRLRGDPRVEVIERVNARHLSPGDVPYAPELITVDVSFISLAKVLPALSGLLAPHGEVLALVKPQFELGRGRVGRGGVVREAADRREALVSVARAAGEAGLHVRGFASSGLPGPKGNLRDVHPLHARPARGRSRSCSKRRGSSRSSRECDTTPRHRPRLARRPSSRTPTLSLTTRRCAPPSKRPSAPRSFSSRAPDELEKHGDAASGVRQVDSLPEQPDVCLVLGGDGTILQGAAHVRRDRGAGVRNQLRDRRLPRGGRGQRARGGSRAGVLRRLRGDVAPGARGPAGRRASRGAQRRELHAPPARPGRRAVLPARGTGGRARALRRPGRRHAGRVDRLQPRQPGADPGVGSRGVRGQLRGTAHAHSASPGGRSRRRPARPQRRRTRSRRHRARRRDGRRAWQAARSSRFASATPWGGSPRSRAQTSIAGSARSSAASPSRWRSRFAAARGTSQARRLHVGSGGAR